MGCELLPLLVNELLEYMYVLGLLEHDIRRLRCARRPDRRPVGPPTTILADGYSTLDVRLDAQAAVTAALAAAATVEPPGSLPGSMPGARNSHDERGAHAEAAAALRRASQAAPDMTDLPVRPFLNKRSTPRTVAMLAAIPLVWFGAHVFLFPKLHAMLKLDATDRADLLAFTGDYLEAIGTVYAIFLGFTYNLSVERLRGLERSVHAEATALQAVVELTLHLQDPHLRQLHAIQASLCEYVERVLSLEMYTGVQRVEAGTADAARTVHAIYGVLTELNEIASDGVGDGLDRCTLEAVHQEIRTVLRERSSRIMHTNQRLPAAHWLLLSALSILTVLGVAIGEVSARVETGLLVSALAFVAPLAFVLVFDMNDAFDGVWRASAAPVRGVQQHVLPLLACRDGGRGGAAAYAD